MFTSERYQHILECLWHMTIGTSVGRFLLSSFFLITRHFFPTQCVISNIICISSHVYIFCKWLSCMNGGAFDVNWCELFFDGLFAPSTHARARLAYVLIAIPAIHSFLIELAAGGFFALLILFILFLCVIHRLIINLHASKIPQNFVNLQQ